MSIRDKNFERRMIVSKYSNRPPFDLKKPREFYDVAEKIKSYPEESCKSCCRNRTEKVKDVSRSSKSLPPEVFGGDTASRIPPVKRVIPKIIENFQRLTSAEDTVTTMSKNTSIQTLFRNTDKTCKLGKNIPKHKLMKSLLHNLDSDAEHYKKSSANFDASKNSCYSNKGSKNKKIFFDRDEVIRTDAVRFDLKSNDQGPLIKSAKNISNDVGRNKPQKVDKKTSTTGLTWPPQSKEMLQYFPIKTGSNNQLKKISSQPCRCVKIDSASFDTVKEEHRMASNFASESFLDEVPIKDVLQVQKCNVQPSISERLLRAGNNEINHYSRQKIVDVSKTLKQTCKTLSFDPKPSDKIERKSESRIKSFPDKPKSKEKTFVQTQVEKLDKVMRNTKIPGPTGPYQISGAVRKDLGHQPCRNFEVRGQGDALNLKETATNYMGLMDRIRSNCPQFARSNNESDQNWSDTSETEMVPEQIRFPRETKAAIDQCLIETRQRIPLSKFTNVQTNCRPAISLNIESARDNAYFEDYSDLNQQGDYEKQRLTKNKDVGKSGTAKSRLRFNVPCKKNLLCDKGEQHLGPCGYTHNHNKVIY